jgi:hypothetical protein
MISFDFNKPFEKQLEFFRQKGFLFSPNSWRDVWAEAHARAFTVARVTEMDILEDIRKSIDDAKVKGTSIEQFKKDLRAKLESRGWFAPPGSIVEGTDGRKKLTGWRLDTIYRTNMAAAYQTGRYIQMQEVKRFRPWWQYKITPKATNRKTHKVHEGEVYHADHEFWNVWFPPNGFNCGCYVKTLSDRQMESRGLEAKKKYPKIKPDEGWNYNPGEAGLDAWKPDFSAYPPFARKILKNEVKGVALIKAAAFLVAKEHLDKVIPCDTVHKAARLMKFATDAMDSAKAHRIDHLWGMIQGRMTRAEFERWVQEIDLQGMGRLQGGDFSDLSGGQSDHVMKLTWI